MANGISSTHGNLIGLNVSSDLAEAMKTNPRLKVMVNGGYYDLATPFFGAEYEEKHLPIPQSLAKNIEYDWYESGHMVYVRDECLKQLHDRVAAFIKSASNRRMIDSDPWPQTPAGGFQAAVA